MNHKKHDRIPDFLVIGAGKSGTTSLDNYLKQHPQLFIPKVKEPNFFGYEQTKIEEFRGDPEEINHYKNSVTNLDDYLKLFNSATKEQLKGETSNTYLYHKNAPERIKFYNPDIKLIAMLRHPTGRLYSRYMHLARENRLPTKNFSDCLDKESIWWKRNDLVKEGFYYKNLERYYQLFPKEQIRVYLYEDFNKDPEALLKDIFKFLNIDENINMNLSVKYNQSGIAKSKFLNKMYGPKGFINETIKSILPKTAIKKIKANLSFQRLLNNLRKKNLTQPKIDPILKHTLTHDVYGDDIQNLQKLIDKDLSHWLTA